MPVLEWEISKKDWDHGLGPRNGVSLENERQPAAAAGPWQEAIQKIVGFQALENDWDGFGAKAPSPELLNSAFALAYALGEKGTDPPDRVVPGVTGTILLEWQFSDGTYGEIEIVRPFYAEVMMIKPGEPAKLWTLPTEEESVQMAMLDLLH